MDIAALSTGMAQNQLMTDVGVAMLGKQIDTAKAAGNMVAASIQAAPSPSLESMVNPAVGRHIDLAI